MSDPLSITGPPGALPGAPRAEVVAPAGIPGHPATAGRAFEQEFLAEVAKQIDEVSRLQGDADLAAEDLVTGRRDDVEGVMIATQKADTAFRMLLAVRNRMMEAYEEVKQIRI